MTRPGALLVAILGTWWVVTGLLFLAGATESAALMLGGGIGHLIGLALIFSYYALVSR